MTMILLSPETLAPIRARFIEALRDREVRLRRSVTTAEIGEPAQLLEDIHKIRGVAPMLGMATLGALAADAEDRLEPWLAAATIAPPQVPPGPAPAARLPEDLHACLTALHAAMQDAIG